MLPRPKRGKPTKESPSQTRRNFVFKRDLLMCRYCGLKLSREDATLDHVMPRSRYGGNGVKNLVTCCGPCNQVKADMTPEEAGMVLLPVPLPEIMS